MTAGRRPAEPPLGACKVCGSSNVSARNLCGTHYRKMRKSGELPKLPLVPRVCECGSYAAAMGLCWKHYRRKRYVELVQRPSCHDGRKHQWTSKGRCKVCQMEK